MFAAVWTTPSRTTDGSVRPIVPGASSFVTISFTTAATASGVAGCGVGMRMRSAVKAPAARSTGAPLMPVPPMSTPMA